MSITFLYDGPLPTDRTDIDEFTMACGDLQLSSGDPGVKGGGYVISADGYGGPTVWHFFLTQEPLPGFYMTSLGGLNIDNEIVTDDYVAYLSEEGDHLGWKNNVSGTIPWKVQAVPVPSAMLLLGSGLLGLVGCRRFQKG
ncbi:MAG: PEP-CTERM sorting domain-containing protein [Syntrophobacterales bacterium]